MAQSKLVRFIDQLKVPPAPAEIYRGEPLLEPEWYAVMTEPQAESKASTWLNRKGYHAIYPFDRHRVIANKRAGAHRWIERPRFARYVFVALRYRDEPLGPISETPGVSSIVCRRFSGSPLRIPTRVMEALLSERLVMADDERRGVLMSEIVRTGDVDLQMFINDLGKRAIRALDPPKKNRRAGRQESVPRVKRVYS